MCDLHVTPVHFHNLHGDARQFKSHRPMNLQCANLNRLDMLHRDLRDLKGLRLLVAAGLLNHVDPYAARLTYIY